ncbi:MAG TPA: 2-oxo-4-hydroxy-4-carboxy-5-ureidoimidazoline decarboxylase [Steroidobacteraceae bacterium]|nr:2-oxo-4-hydroxy-4-carboxy-5-ureidoimidazoline decarboxylase [Steroidobacteraceae bacterium]
MLTIEALNAMSAQEFTAALGSVFEHSPWVAARVAALRPCVNREQLHRLMCAQVAQASAAEQDALILAHPRLGARGRQRDGLTRNSAREQSRAGLDACTDEQFAQLLSLNERYMSRFGFPFIIAVRGHTPESILAAMSRRLDQDPATERATALQQIERIAALRLADAVTDAPLAR